MKVSVTGSRAMRAVVLAMKVADRGLRSDINKATRATLGPEWKTLVEHHAARRLDGLALAKGARILAGNPPVAVAATSRRRLRGGLLPAEQWQAVEFGADRTKLTEYQRRSRTGGTHDVRRHTARQMPPRYKPGRVLFQAFAQIVPRAASLWGALVVRKYLDAADKAGE